MTTNTIYIIIIAILIALQISVIDTSPLDFGLWESGKKFKIAVVQEDPFSKATPLGYYSGFLVDVMEELALKLNFTPSYYTIKDNKYGHRNRKGHWNGLVDELVNGPADIVLAALTVSRDRQTYIDYSLPFMNTSLGMYLRRPEPSEGVSFGTLRELVENSKNPPFGFVKDSGMEAYFRNSASNFDLHRKVITLVDNYFRYSPSTHKTGAYQAENGPFVLIAERAIMDYAMQTSYCNLMVIPIRSSRVVHYALGFRKHSKLRPFFDEALVSIQSKIDAFRRKWWSLDGSKQKCVKEYKLCVDKTGL